MSEEEPAKIYDTRAWTGDTSGGLAVAIGKTGAKALDAIQDGSAANAANEAKDVPAIMAISTAVGLSPILGDWPALAIMCWAHVQRTKARMQAEHPDRKITNKAALSESLRVLKQEWEVAGMKTGIEWDTRDRNGDGVVSFGELVSTVGDIVGNYMPAEGGARGLALDAMETGLSWIALGAVGGVAKEAGANTVEQAVAGFAIAVPTVAGVISVSKRDEAYLDNFRKTPVGAFMHGILGFDGKVGPGNDSYFEKLGLVPPKADDPIPAFGPRSASAYAVPADEPSYGFGGDGEDTIVLSPAEMETLHIGIDRRRINLGDIDLTDINTVSPDQAYAAPDDETPPTNPPAGGGGGTVAGTAKKRPGLKFDNSGMH